MNDPQTALAGWVQALERELDLPAGTVDVVAVLDLTRDAAHHVARPAGPVAAYAAGYARALADVAARASSSDGSAPVATPLAASTPLTEGSADAVERAAALARGWEADGAPGTP
ncbi:hypothetical protein Xcel_1831 [Xylanimonas cellulosilytica DSM 15894]|uniref:DUF6457 domain-containing protein n=1 Tax=Xylanimonas cellulosilytica (strain DSM 15894 / JCM 12276 / CECT 5975 / KCTC 9989 / LMG 20990 / NBRC 107835 / XIL07) TaxID=446471 RepID=D1BT09_XYLCX|nr:DUF6457 domain-containing protein [Xylanimonas cellulosilytica]ACZ30851.1 hypothetical protein Xcel_1831 [Xylanimonas cellulosilytica DSM 15894]